MLDGLKSGFDTFDYRLKAGIVGVSGSGGRIGGITQITSYYTPDPFTVNIGAILTVETNSAGIGPPGLAGKVASISLPDLSISQTYTNATPGDVVSHLDFIGCRKIIMPSGTFRLTIASIEWWVNGSLHWSSSAGWTLTSGMVPAPSSDPLWGVPPRIGGNSRTAFAPIVGCIPFSLPTNNISCSGQSTGGWEIKIDGAWVQAPIALFPRAETTHTGSITASDCANVTINHSVLITSGGFSSSAVTKSGEVLSISPNWDSSIQKMFPNFNMDIFRWGFPKVQRFDNDHYIEFDCEGEVVSESGGVTYTEIYPLYTQFLAKVGDSTHIIEEPLVRTKYAPCVVGGSENLNWSTGYSQQFWGSGMHPVIDDSTMSNNLKNLDATYGYLAEYLNTIVMPDSSYGLWFPKDDASSSVRWDLLGADADIAYWLANRQQHAKHPALPEEENTGERINIVNEALDQNGFTGTTNTMIGLPCFWGSDLIQLSGESYPESLTTDTSSSSRFSSPTLDAVVTVGSGGITI